MPTEKQRRAAQRRRVQRQNERRAERAARRRRINLIVSIGGALALVAVVIGVIVATTGSDPKPAKKPTRSTSAARSSVSPPPSTSAAATASTGSAASTKSASSTAASSSSPARSASSTATDAATATTTATCHYPMHGTAARPVHRPPARAPSSGTATVRLTTSRGPLVFQLDRTSAPCTVNSFVSLTKQGYYRHTSCHRLVTANIYVLQCGDPTGTGRGGPGYEFGNEGTPAVRDAVGSLVMTDAGPDSNGSQFSIVWRASSLGDYTTFGRVTSGLPALLKVAQAGTTNGSTDGRPKLPVTFDSVRVS